MMGVSVDEPDQHLAFGEAGPHRASRGGFPQEDPYGEEIGAAVDGVIGFGRPQLFGREIRDLPLDHAVFRLRAARELRDTEVQHFDVAVVRDDEVLRRYVAMDDAERASVVSCELVDVVQPFERFGQHEELELEGERRTQLVSQGRQRRSIEVLHGQNGHTGDLERFVDLHDVRVRHVRREPRFGEEVRPNHRILGQRRFEALEHAQLAEPAEPSLLGEVHLGRTSLAELLEDVVSPQLHRSDRRCGRARRPARLYAKWGRRPPFEARPMASYGDETPVAVVFLRLARRGRRRPSSTRSTGAGSVSHVWRTSTVKHFDDVPHGKERPHARRRDGQVRACRLWLLVGDGRGPCAARRNRATGHLGPCDPREGPRRAVVGSIPADRGRT